MAAQMSIVDELGLLPPLSPPARATPVRTAPTLTPPPATPARIRDASELLKTEPAPINYVIPGWIPEGLMLLAAPPKVGKSTLVLQVAACLASGQAFWGCDVPKAQVLIIDLETNERRLRRKLAEAGVSDLERGMLQYATTWPRGLGGVQQLADTLDHNPGIKLVIIDTLQRFRDASGGKQNAYAADYDAMAPLQQLCRERAGLAIICVHHKRKAASDDPVDSINGSSAIAGAVDTIWLMGRKAGDYVLYVQARDWEREQDEFRIERDQGRWALADGPRYSQSEIEVLKLLDATKGMTATQMAQALNVSRQSAWARLTRMRNLGIVRNDGECWVPAS